MSYTSLDSCPSPAEKILFPGRSTFTLHPKTLVKMLIPAGKEPVRAKFFSYFGMTAWKWNASGEQNKAGLGVRSPARIRCEETERKPIVCVFEYTDIPAQSRYWMQLRLSSGRTALRAHDYTVIRQLVWTLRPGMRLKQTVLDNNTA